MKSMTMILEDNQQTTVELNYDDIGIGVRINGDCSDARIDIILDDEDRDCDDDYQIPIAKATLTVEKAKEVYDILGKIIAETENILDRNGD